MCIAQTIAEKIDPASWYMRKQGWAGSTNPSNILRARTNKLVGIGDGKTATEKRAVRMGISARDKAHEASSVKDTVPGHVKAIAARKAG